MLAQVRHARLQEASQLTRIISVGDQIVEVFNLNHGDGIGWVSGERKAEVTEKALQTWSNLPDLTKRRSLDDISKIDGLVASLLEHERVDRDPISRIELLRYVNRVEDLLGRYGDLESEHPQAFQRLLRSSGAQDGESLYDLLEERLDSVLSTEEDSPGLISKLRDSLLEIPVEALTDYAQTFGVSRLIEFSDLVQFGIIGDLSKELTVKKGDEASLDQVRVASKLLRVFQMMATEDYVRHNDVSLQTVRVDGDFYSGALKCCDNRYLAWVFNEPALSEITDQFLAKARSDYERNRLSDPLMGGFEAFITIWRDGDPKGERLRRAVESGDYIVLDGIASGWGGRLDPDLIGSIAELCGRACQEAAQLLLSNDSHINPVYDGVDRECKSIDYRHITGSSDLVRVSSLARTVLDILTTDVKDKRGAKISENFLANADISALLLWCLGVSQRVFAYSDSLNKANKRVRDEYSSIGIVRPGVDKAFELIHMGFSAPIVVSFFRSADSYEHAGKIVEQLLSSNLPHNKKKRWLTECARDPVVLEGRLRSLAKTDDVAA